MKFNYRDFFIHNDDLHIIKEQLSIVDEVKVSKKDALESNAKAVWDMYQIESDEKTIADTLKINVETVKKIIQMCLMNIVYNKNTKTISTELNITDPTVQAVLNQSLGSERERDVNVHFSSDAVKIYNLHKNGSEPADIVVLVNKEKKEYFKKITVKDVNLVLTIVKIAEEQMIEKNVVNIQKIAQKILKEFGKKIDVITIRNLITKLNLGEPRYTHKFTEEQDAFILYCYLQGHGPSEIARQFNEKFSNDSIKLNIMSSSIRLRLKNNILEPKDKSETDISQKVIDLLNIYKTEYFSTVNMEDPVTKDVLTHYRPPQTVRGRDTTGTGTNRDMSAHLGTVPKNFNTMITNLVS